MTMSSSPQPPAGGSPRPPDLTFGDVLRQYWHDIYGKEVQDAVTYSYMWIADQSGHVGLGFILYFIVTFVAHAAFFLTGILKTWNQAIGWDQAIGVIITSIAVSLWERSAYKTSVAKATGVFPLGVALLRRNAIVASSYMVLGALAAFIFDNWSWLPASPDWLGWAKAVVFGVLTAVGVSWAPWWLRQKMIWQKAALPYLSRLADVQRNVNKATAAQVQAMINATAPPGGPPRQVVIGGPIGSGRTAFASGIGTEFAFKEATVRYVSFGNLLEFVAAAPTPPPYANDPGPWNIVYWQWNRAQVIIIDDVGPVIAAQTPDPMQQLALFNKLLHGGLGPIAGLLAHCHTVWVIGDLAGSGTTALQGSALDQFAQAITAFLGTKAPALQPAIVVEM